ncbi:uncharacterized protein E0L32_011753 [Thyridium curvatum]|uniref:Nephrocystin 3-like N-terminal domain-containing protein n=1 Tax=Thyridium curvatum TaxID=1093900 RepID=A0A507B7P0_9PEZI|nr:uncharacterized protein E0L32_011753 [Thyridium curvatum]TPX18342.1 hypothetical protein E0L32_011753 [Thyridium curvatum]
MPRSINTADEYDFVDHDETALSPEAIAQIREWLQPTDYLAESGELRRHLASQAPGTGLWMCETDEYRKWHGSPDHGSLWIKGIPGAGKSVTAAAIIQHLRTTEDCPVLFFFFRNIIAANFSHRALIQDWLAQLLPHSPKLQFALEARLQTKLAETTDNELIELFLEGLCCVPKVYCVADALDEMTTDNRPFLDKLNSLATYRPRSLKLLITSRPKQHLQSALRDSSIVHISLQQKLVDADIMSYLHHRFDQAPKARPHNEMKQQVIDMVARKSQGLFLYAKLTLDQVEASLLAEEPINVTALEELLPVGLEQTYDSVLAKQRREHGLTVELQVTILEAVTHSSRPLRLHELSSLLKCICPGLAAPKAFKSLVANSCGSLVEILEDETLQIIHHSFTEFLRGETRSQPGDTSAHGFPVINSSNAHKRLAISCLQYLQSGSLLLEDELEFGHRHATRGTADVDCSGGSAENERTGRLHEHPFDYKAARLSHPFLRYAVENWCYHASHHDEDDEDLFNAVARFFDPHSVSFRRWLSLQLGQPRDNSPSPEKLPTPLHVAAFSGLSRLVSKLIGEGADVSALDTQDRLAIHWAAAKGHAKVISLLLRHGSHPDPADCRGIKPIHLAALGNHASAVTALLEAGVKPDTIKTMENHGGYLRGGETITKGESAILYVSRGGYAETAVAMVPFCDTGQLEQLLCECCRFNRTDAVLAVLDNCDVSGNATFAGATALYFACRNSSTHCVQALLDRGADPKATSTWRPRRTRWGGMWIQEGETPPLHQLVRDWADANGAACQAILDMLLEAGADVDQLDFRGDTALLVAAGAPGLGNNRGPLRVRAIRALLAAGADANKAQKRGNSLHLMFNVERNLKATKLLVEHGCDPNLKGEYGRTALHYLFLPSGSVRQTDNTADIARYLLEQGADPNILDQHGNSAIYRSMSCGPDVFSVLLPMCKGESIKRQCWFSLALNYHLDRFSQYLELLLASGMDIDTRRQDNGRTLYLCCSASQDKIEILRQHGAKRDVVDKQGNSALHVLCQLESPDQEWLERLMVEDGLSPLSPNNQGKTLLHHVAHWYNKEAGRGLVLRLLDLGVPVNAIDMEGNTALHVYLKKTLNRSTTQDALPVNFYDAINVYGDVDFEIRDGEGLTALHLAVIRCDIEMAMLVAAGADLAALTDDGQNVLHLACRARLPNTVWQILDRLGAIDINQPDRHRRTPLHWACRSGEPESVALLLDHGADVHVTDADGCTPLHACAEFRLEQSIWDALGQSSHGWLRGPPQDPLRPGAMRRPHTLWTSPWYHANPKYTVLAAPGRNTLFAQATTILRLLLEAQSDPSVLDKGGCTALDRALANDCPELVEVYAKDEQLFAKATENIANTPDHESLGGRADEFRDYLRSQMALMCRTSPLTDPGEDQEAIDRVRKAPHIYLELLSCQTAAALITKAFEADPLDVSLYTTLSVVLKSGRFDLIARLSSLVTHYSSYTALQDYVQRGSNRGETTLFTPLQLVCQSERPNMLLLKLLVEVVEVDVDAQNVQACELDQWKAKPNLEPGGTALHILASADNRWQVDAIEFLLEHGASVDVKDAKGETPLHVASQGTKYSGNKMVKGIWRPKAVRVLLSHGADPSSLDAKGLSPLHKASKAPEVMRLLLNTGADAAMGARSPLFQAIYDQNLAALEILLDHGVSVDSVDEKKQSSRVNYQLREPRKVYALLCAAYAEQINTRVASSIPLFRALVVRGADLYAPLNDKETMIQFLFTWPTHEVLDALLTEPCVSRIDFDHRDQCGRTVLHAACDWCQTLPGYRHEHWLPKVPGPALRILDHGADATLVDNEGKTPLHHLLENNAMPDDVLLQFIDHPEVTPTLFVKDKAGFSPLHYALRNLRPVVCESFCAKGAELLEADPDGRTVLHHIAAQCLLTRRDPPGRSGFGIELDEDHFDRCRDLWVRYLSQKGSSINVIDNDGNTPLHAFLLAPDKDLGYNTKVPPNACCHLEHFAKLFPESSGLDVFAVNKAGETALHVVAAREGNGRGEEHDKVLFKALMAKGLDPLKEDIHGRSALDVASACEKEDVLSIFGRS